MKIVILLPRSFVTVVAICLFGACAAKRESTTTATTTTAERVIQTGAYIPPISLAPSPEELTREPAADLELMPGTTIEPPKLRKGEHVSVVKLLFATDRRWTGSKSQPKWFGANWNEGSGHLTYGTCEVSIPVRVHKPGDVEKPSIWRFEIIEDPTKHVVVYTPQRLAHAAFFTTLEQEVRARAQREIIVFIHGFNNTFDDAASRLAVLDYDIQFGGVPILYSWCSFGGGDFTGVLNYTHDEEIIKRTYRPFTNFLAEVAQSGRVAGARRISIVAHSMGNRALVAAMQKLAERMQGKLLFDELVMGAPDVPTQGFATDEWPEMRHANGGPARRVTLYASSHDRALLASKVIHRYRRIGESGDGLLLLPGLDTIDVSKCDFSLIGLNHTYFGGPRVLNDLSDLVRKGLTPAQRKLNQANRGALPYWLMRR